MGGWGSIENEHLSGVEGRTTEGGFKRFSRLKENRDGKSLEEATWRCDDVPDPVYNDP